MPDAGVLGSQSVRSVLLAHGARYPRWQVQDIYKLVHQGATGSEHAISDDSRARAWLVRELSEMGLGAEEPLVDPIAPDGSVVRIHLRPFVRMGFNAETLLAAFLRTAREFHGSAEAVERGLAEAAQLAGEGLVSVDRKEVERIGVRMKAAGFPAVHHSAAYVEVYRPAYRVVALSFVPREWRAPHAIEGPSKSLGM